MLADIRGRVVVFGIGKNLLFKSVLGHCEIGHVTSLVLCKNSCGPGRPEFV